MKAKFDVSSGTRGIGHGTGGDESLLTDHGPQGRMFTNEQAVRYRTERDALQAQVAVLRRALDRARKGFVNQIDLKLLVDEKYEWATNKLAQSCFEALSDTPAEAAERVQRLVTALEEIQKSGTGWDDDGSVVRTYEAMLAASALSDWRRNHDS